jgi:hypothetical protein
MRCIVYKNVDYQSHKILTESAPYNGLLDTLVLANNRAERFLPLYNPDPSRLYQRLNIGRGGTKRIAHYKASSLCQEFVVAFVPQCIEI